MIAPVSAKHTRAYMTGATVRCALLVAVLMGGLLLLAACAKNETGGFRFAVLGDSRGSQEVLPAIIDSLNKIRPDLAVHLGDLIHGYTEDVGIVKKQWSIVDRQLSNLGVPLLVAPGNHDTYTGKSNADPRLLEFLNQRFGRWPLSVKRFGALFLLVNSSRPGEEQRIGASQLEWLERELNQWGNRGPVFLFLHHPLVSPSGRSLINADEVLRLLSRNTVKTVFCSHDHMYQHTILPSGITQYITGGAGAPLRGLAPERGGFFHFLLVTCRDRGGVSVKVHRLNDVSEEADKQPTVDYGY